MSEIDVNPPQVPTLYHVPYFCSSIPYHVAMELEVPPTELVIKQITEGDLRQGSDMPKISPRRKVPALALPDGSVILEAGAIVMWILERFDKQNKLHARVGDEKRAKMFQAIFYVMTECYRSSLKVYDVCFRIDKKDRDQEKLAVVKAEFEEVVNDHLVMELGTSGGYYLGEEFSVADVMFSYVLMCGDYFDCGLVERDIIADYFQKISTRKAYRQLYWMEE